MGVDVGFNAFKPFKTPIGGTSLRRQLVFWTFLPFLVHRLVYILLFSSFFLCELLPQLGIGGPLSVAVPDPGGSIRSQ